MRYSDLKLNEKYILKKENVLAWLKGIYDFQPPTMYRFETDTGSLYFFDATTPETDDIEPLEITTENNPTHKCTFKLYVGLIESFSYCTVCNKRK